jgi:hypothetical protein
MRRATCDLLALFLLSAASLAFEVNLTRLFSVAQFYHFAFMTVSLALLGFGASGTFLSLAGGRIRHPERALTLLAWTFALTAVGSYGLTQALPFDSFRVALDPRQWGILALHYVALSLPFFCAGAATGLLLSLPAGRGGPDLRGQSGRVGPGMPAGGDASIPHGRRGHGAPDRRAGRALSPPLLPAPLARHSPPTGRRRGIVPDSLPSPARPGNPPFPLQGPLLRPPVPG